MLFEPYVRFHIFSYRPISMSIEDHKIRDRALENLVP